MTAIHLLNKLENMGIRLEAQDDRLRFNPVRLVSDALQAEMLACKPELLELLRDRQEQATAKSNDEINWRVAAMREQLTQHQGAIVPMLTAQQGISGRKGYCFSCGEKLSQFEGLYSCDLCIQAKYLALGVA